MKPRNLEEVYRKIVETGKDKYIYKLIFFMMNFIEQYKTTGFDAGGFSIVRTVLRELEQAYPEIHYAVVLAYLPGKKNEYDDFSDTIFPEGIEAVHPRYAVDWRNRWMLQRADFVVTCITHPWGGAAKFAEKAKREGKTVINLFRQ